MKLNIWFDHEKQAPLLENYVIRKAQEAFLRYGHQLSNGEIRLRFTAGRDGPITHCSLDLKSHANGVIHVTECDESGRIAIMKAIRAAQAKLKRASERRKATGRRRARVSKHFVRSAEFESAIRN